MQGNLMITVTIVVWIINLDTRVVQVSATLLNALPINLQRYHYAFYVCVYVNHVLALL